MRKYLLRRAVFALGTLIGVSLIIFVVLRILPGDPLVAILGVEGHAKMAPADRARIMQDLGFAAPLPVQYLRWLRDIASGQLGKSFFRGDTVAALILHRGPLSAEIGILALVISWLVGLPVGLLSAIRPNGWADAAARSLAILFIAVPGFWLSMLTVLALLFWFNYKAPIIIVQPWENPWQNLQLIIGPAVVLGLAQGAYIARMSRSCLLEVIREDYIRTARAKGALEGGARRLGGRRAGLRRAGPRASPRHRRYRARYHRRAEPGPPLRPDLRGRQRARGSLLRLARSAYPVLER